MKAKQLLNVVCEYLFKKENPPKRIRSGGLL
jgi:hypothetical protein